MPGVGKRLAARIVLELHEKVAAAGTAAAAVGPAAAGTPALAESEVVAALQALGYTLAEARAAARAGVSTSPPGLSLEERVKAALLTLVHG